jgi:hypothetical protein
MRERSLRDAIQKKLSFHGFNSSLNLTIFGVSDEIAAKAIPLLSEDHVVENAQLSSSVYSYAKEYANNLIKKFNTVEQINSLLKNSHNKFLLSNQIKKDVETAGNVQVPAAISHKATFVQVAIIANTQEYCCLVQDLVSNIKAISDKDNSAIDKLFGLMSKVSKLSAAYYQGCNDELLSVLSQSDEVCDRAKGIINLYKRDLGDGAGESYEPYRPVGGSLTNPGY